MRDDTHRGLARLIALSRRLLRDRSGGPAMEFAVIAPIFAVCCIFAFDLANALQQRIRLGEALRAGGLYAMSYPTNATNDVNSTPIQNAITNAVSDWTDVTVATPVMACYCWSSSGGSNGTYTSVTCSTASSSSCSGSELRRYITLSASRPFAPVLLTNISTISFSHVVRFQ